MSHTTPGRTRPRSPLMAAGTVAFAGVMLTAVAAFQIIEGIAAIASDKVYLSGISYTYELDVTTWGWIHLVLGLLGMTIGIGILGGQPWALLGGIVIAFLSALTNFVFLPYYPFWTIVVLAFDALVIWALCNEIGRADGAT